MEMWDNETETIKQERINGEDGLLLADGGCDAE